MAARDALNFLLRRVLPALTGIATTPPVVQQTSGRKRTS